MGAVYTDMSDVIQSNGLGTKEVDMWGGTMPNKPDFMIGVYESPGAESEWAMGRRVLDEVALQILVRDLKTTIARTRAFQIFEMFSEFNFLPIGNRVVNGVQYHFVMPRHPPYPIGQDENSRFRWTCNYRVKLGA